jgi:hypothetical protein
MKRTLLAITLLSLSAFAQTPAPPPTNSPQFTLNFNALNGPLGSTGVDIGATYAVTSNYLLRADNLIFPAVNGQYFGAGIQAALPTCSWLANTNLNCEKFQLYGTGSAGESRITIGSNPATNRFAGMFGTGANYDPTGTGKFTVNLIDFHVAWLPGMASGPVYIASVGFNLGWGTNQAAVTQNAARRLAREKKKLAKLQRAAGMLK